MNIFKDENLMSKYTATYATGQTPMIGDLVIFPCISEPADSVCLIVSDVVISMSGDRIYFCDVTHNLHWGIVAFELIQRGGND